MARLRTATATSAGGIVVRYEAGRPQLVREVAEETGLEVRITGPLSHIEYTFVQSGTRIHKTVHYFLMEAVGGDLERHDHEFEQVRWIDFAEAPAVLTFETERALVAQAASVLAPPSAAGDIERALGSAFAFSATTALAASRIGCVDR